MSAAAPNILIIRRRYLGDVVLLGSLLRNLRLQWPQVRLTVLVEPRFAEVLTLNPDANSVLFLPERVGQWPGFLRELRRARFTHVLDLDNSDKTAAVARLSGAPIRVGLHHGIHRLKLGFAYNRVVHDPTELHENRPITDYYLRALEPLAVPVKTREIRLVPREKDLAGARSFAGGGSGRILLVHPGSRSPMRIWPAERFADVCDYAQDELGAQVVLIGGPGEAETIEQIRRHARTHLLTPKAALPIGSFAALASISAAFLCHDSGPMHVAAGVGTRVIALYGSQNAALFRPIGEGHTLLQPPLPCATCVAPDRCTRDDSYKNLCVQNIPVERVKAAVRSALSATSETR
jgi:ADP-heptose:LPS heptosyltransferase